MADFVWSDAWVLLALIWARKPVGRKGIVATGDFLNHAIMNDSELEGGLRRLQSAGYIVETKTGFDLAAKGRRLSDSLAQLTMANLLELFTAVEEQLAVKNS